MLTKEYLFEEYYTKKKTMKEIAKENGVSYFKIFSDMKKYGLKRRTNSESHIGFKHLEETKRKQSIAQKRIGNKPPIMKLSGSEHPGWKGGPINYSCDVCGESFEDYRKGRKYCSRECLYKAVRLGKGGNWKGGLIEHVCEQCGKSFKTYPHRADARFCSHECYSQISAEKTANWQGGKSYEPYCHLFNVERKENIRNRDGRVCQLCGKSGIENGERLSVHHIDGDKMQGCEGKGFYLCALCRSCNSKKDDDVKEFLIVANNQWITDIVY